MILKVIRYYDEMDAHECVLPDGRKRYVDLTTDNSKIGTNESLVGRSVEVTSLTPYLDIAYEVRLIQEVN